MKNKYKILICVALLIATVFCFTACAVPENPKTITIWHYYNNDQKTAFDALVEKFNQTVGKEKNIIVKAESKGYVDTLADNVIDSAKEATGADPMPNIFMSYADTAYNVDRLGKVAALDPYFTEEELSDYVSDFLSEGRFDGEHLKIFPIAKSTEILMINKTDWDKFQTANPGVSLDQLKTIEGVIEVSKKYFEYCGKAFYGRDSLSNYFIAGSKMLGEDLMGFDADGNFRVNFNESILRKLWDCYYVPSVKGYFYGSGAFRSTDVGSGNILCYTGSTSSSLFFPDKVWETNDEYYGIEHYVLPAPKLKDGADIAVQQGAGLVVTKSDAATEAAAVEFLKWFTKPEVNSEFSANSSYLPVTKTALKSDYIETRQNLNPRVKDALTVSRDVVLNNTMYTNVPSEYSNAVRTIVLDKHLETFVTEARQRIENHESTQADEIGEAAFLKWLNDFKEKVSACYRPSAH